MDVLHDYGEFLRVRGYADSSRKERLNMARRWMRHAPDGGDERVFAEYLSQYKNPRYRISIWICVKNFIKFLAKSGFCADWTGEVRVKAIRKENYVLLSPEEVRALVAKCWSPNPWLRERDRTILILLYTTACRNSEIRLLRRDNVSLAESWIEVHLKGGRDVRVHLTPQAAEQLSRWLETVKGDWVFPAYANRRKPLGITRFHNLVSEHAAAAQLGKRVTPHTLRRAAATNCLRAGAKLEEVQGMLHHECIETTLIYAKLSDLKVAQVQDEHLRL